MSKFKKDDRVVFTHPSRAGQRGRIIGVHSGGYRVQIDGTGRGSGVFYYDVDMEHEPGNPLVPQKEETMDHGNASWQTPDQSSQPTSYVLSKDNFTEVAEWCGPETRVVSPWTTPRLLVKTGFETRPEFRVTVCIGDRIERLADGKLQVWVHQDNVAWDEDPDIVKEDRPEMLMPSGFAPQAHAIALVQSLHYGEESDNPLGVEDIYIVWFCKTLQNWKAMVSTNAKDDAYYEVTHNGDKNETYVDRYVKATNTVVRHNEDTFEMTEINLFCKA